MTTNTSTADTEPGYGRPLNDQCRSLHPGCVVCDPDNPNGLSLQCEPDGAGRVVARFQPRPWMVGYPGQMHGGVISALLDGAMTQCVFAHNGQAVTAVMHVRFRHPAPLGQELIVRAWIEHSASRRHRLRAQVVAGGVVVAEAEAAFVSRRVTGIT